MAIEPDDFAHVGTRLADIVGKRAEAQAARQRANGYAALESSRVAGSIRNGDGVSECTADRRAAGVAAVRTGQGRGVRLHPTAALFAAMDP